jgi:hypothetical protein
VDITFTVYDKTNTTAETIGKYHKKIHTNSRYQVEQQIKMRGFVICSVHRNCSGYVMEEDGMRWTSGTFGVKIKSILVLGAQTCGKELAWQTWT